MNFHHRRRSVPQLNTTSTADISFMLLIFFLVTTNMDVDKGITRHKDNSRVSSPLWRKARYWICRSRVATGCLSMVSPLL